MSAQSQYEKARVFLEEVESQYENTKMLKEAMAAKKTELYSEDLSAPDSVTISVRKQGEETNYFEIVGAQGRLALAQCIMSSKTQISKINLGAHPIGTEVQMAIFDSIKSESSCLQILILCGNDIGIEGAKALAQGLASSNITKLDLRLNAIGDEGLILLAGPIGGSIIQKLDLCENEISDKGVESLIEAILPESSSLRKIGLRSNKISDEGAKKISEALGHKLYWLEQLDLRDNNICESGATHLTNVIASTTCSLREIYLSGNYFDYEHTKSLETVFNSNRKIEKIEVPSKDDEVEFFSRSKFTNSFSKKSEDPEQYANYAETSFLSQSSPMPDETSGEQTNDLSHDISPKRLFGFADIALNSAASPLYTELSGEESKTTEDF